MPLYAWSMRQDVDGRYVFTDRPVLITLGTLVFTLCFGVAVWQRFATLHRVDGVLVALALGVGASVAGGFCIPFTRFTFDPARKLITWTTRSIFNSNDGQLAYDSVKSVKIETSTTGDHGVTYRVALVTGEGEVPLGIEYWGSALQAENLAAEVRVALGLG